MIDDTNYAPEPRDANRRPKLNPFELHTGYERQRIMPSRPGDTFIRTGASREEAEQAIKGNYYQHAAIFDSVGRIIARVTSLHTDRVEMTGIFRLTERIQHAFGGAVLTHNHPKRCGPLSPHDFGIAAWHGLREIRAVQSDGSVFSARMKGLRRVATRLQRNDAWARALKLVKEGDRKVPRIMRDMRGAWADAIRFTPIEASDAELFDNILRAQKSIAREFNIDITWLRPNK